MNQCVEQYLRCVVQDRPKTWRRWLAMAEFWYNTSHHVSLGCSPFRALYKIEPNFGGMPNIAVNSTSPVADTAADYQEHTELLRAHLLRAQQRTKSQADRHRIERQFVVGEQVLLKLQPYAQHSVVNRPCHKLSYKYFGPFTVLERIGQVAYRLQLPAAAQVHPVFHVSQLKPFLADYSPVFSELPPPDLMLSDKLPSAILQCRMVRDGNTATTQVLIKWGDLRDDAAMWENYDVVKLHFSSSPLWRDASTQAATSVTHSPASADSESPEPDDPGDGVGPNSQTDGGAG